MSDKSSSLVKSSQFRFLLENVINPQNTGL